MPIALLANCAIAAAQDLTVALQHPSPASPLALIDGRRRDALRQLANIFSNQQPRTIPPGFQPLPDQPQNVPHPTNATTEDLHQLLRMTNPTTPETNLLPISATHARRLPRVIAPSPPIQLIQSSPVAPRREDIEVLPTLCLSPLSTRQNGPPPLIWMIPPPPPSHPDAQALGYQRHYVRCPHLRARTLQS